MTYYALVVIDREIQKSDDTFTWTGRFAGLRQHATRFFELGGGGSSVTAGGGWDFHRITLSCDRATGKLTLAAEPIAFEVAPAPLEVRSPPWMIDELRHMGWRPLDGIDFFGDRLMPKEYSEAVEQFDPDNFTQASQTLYRRWAIEKGLPQHSFVLGLLFDKAGRRDEAVKWMERAVGEGRAGGGGRDPGTLADVARWELSVGSRAAARKHAREVLKLWPDHPVAAEVIRELVAGDDEVT